MVVVLLGIGALTLITPGVAAAAPNAALTMAPSSPEAGQEVTFTDASTDDAAMIVGYEWAVDGDPLGYERTFSHRFDTAGDHEVTLTVVDAREESDSTTVRVEVNEAPSERVRAGEVEARLYYTDSERGFQPMRLQVLRGSRVNYAQIVRPRCRGECPVYPRGGYGRGRSLQAADVTGDDDPEIVFDFGWGNICCRATTVLEFDPGLGRYRARTHNWGDSDSGPLLDLSGKGRMVWRSSDGRIRYAFGCGGCIRYPIQIVAYRKRGFVDVTRRYPAAIRTDARRMWRAYRRGGANARGHLAAWAADQYRLGRKATVWRTVRSALRAGRLRAHGELDAWPHDRAFVRALRRWLNRNGYA